MLVANSLNVVFAIAIVKQRRTFQRLDRADMRSQRRFQVIARSQGSRRPGGGDKCTRRQVSAGVQMVENPFQGRTGDFAVDDVVAVFVELIEDQIIRVLRQQMTGVIDFLDVAFGARRAENVVRIGQPTVQPVETLLAHAFGQDGNRPAS